MGKYDGPRYSEGEWLFLVSLVMAGIVMGFGIVGYLQGSV